jgi:hypothetical protein
MQRYYPAATVSWASKVATLNPSEIAYGLAQGLLEFSNEEAEFLQSTPYVDSIQDIELMKMRDLLFRLLLINLHKRWFCLERPLRALEYLVLDFARCPTAIIGNGRLPSGIAGISESDNPSELDPDYFARKVKTFQFLTPYVTEIVRAGVRPPAAGLGP